MQHSKNRQVRLNFFFSDVTLWITSQTHMWPLWFAHHVFSCSLMTWCECSVTQQAHWKCQRLVLSWINAVFSLVRMNIFKRRICCRSISLQILYSFVVQIRALNAQTDLLSNRENYLKTDVYFNQHLLFLLWSFSTRVMFKTENFKVHYSSVV